MALPKDAVNRLGATVVESTAQPGQAGVVVLLTNGADILLQIDDNLL